MITCKDSVRISVLRPEMYTRFELVEAVFAKYHLATIFSCGSDGHGQDDPHTHGFAYDLRSKHIPRTELKHVILSELRQALGQTYTVILESVGEDNEHFHWQVRKDLWRSML
jgi:hypothetical protein